jgi:hypothetical protein
MPAQQTDKTKPTFDLLSRLGKQPADLTFAVASDPRLGNSTEAANALPLFMIAYHVQGTTAEDLIGLVSIDKSRPKIVTRNGRAVVPGESLAEGDRVVISPIYSGG